MEPEEVAMVAEKELKAHSALQRGIHYIPPDEDDPREAARSEPAERRVEDLFIHPGYETISWHSSPQLALFKGKREHNKVCYEIPSHFSRVFSFYVTATLPQVSVLEKYRKNCRIAWSPNVAANMLGRCRVLYGTEIAEDFPVVADDLERQFNCGKPGQQDVQMRNSGSVGALTCWSAAKPRFGPLYVTPNLHFTRDPSLCIRAGVLDKKSQPTVTFTPRPIQQLLRMQVLKGDGREARWVSVPCDPRLLSFDDEAQDDTLKNRDLPYTASGEVVVVNKEQKVHETVCSDGFLNYIKPYKVLEKAHVGFGEVAEIEITHSSVCVAMFVNAFNERAPGLGCHSNYTTNPEDPEAGVDPIASVALFYDQVPAKVYDAYYMANIESRKCPSQPLETGHHMISFCPCDPFSLSPHALRGIVPKALKLNAKITLQQFSPEMAGAHKEDKFTVVVTMMTVKKLSYIKTDDGPDPAFSISLSE